MDSSEPVVLHISPHARQNICQILGQNGFTVVETTTGVEALRLATSTYSALIILEINLSDENSFELCRQLKENPATAAIPILLCAETFQDMKPERQILISLADGYLTHSVEPLVLLSMVKAFLRPPLAMPKVLPEQQVHHLLVEHSLQGLVIIQNRHVVFANPAATAITGYTLEQVRAPTLDAFECVIHPEDQMRAWQRVQERLAGQTVPPDHEYRIIRRDGYIRWVESFTSLIQYHGQPALQIAFVDITERKQAEETLRQYERIVSATTDGLSLVDRNYVYQLVNHTYLVLNNKYQEEIVGHSVEELLGREAFETVIKVRLDKALAGQTVNYQEWFTFTTQGKRFMNVTYSPYVELDNSISGVVVTLRDLTDLKQAEEALRESQYMLQLVMDHAPQSISWKDKNLVYLGCNRRFAVDAGLDTPAEIIGKTDFELPWYEYAEYYSAEDAEIIDSGKPKLNYEEFQNTPGGKEICIQISKIPLHDAQGNTVGLLGMFEDVTVRVRTEQALRASEAHSRALLEAIPDMICRINRQGRCLQVKTPIDFHPLYPPRELPGATMHDIYPPEQADLLVDLACAAIASHETQHAEIYFENQDQPVYRDIRFAACGEHEALMIVRDITQRKRIEEVLFNTQELLSAFIKYSPAMVFVVSVDGRILLVNQAWEQYFGLHPGEAVGRSAAEIFPPEMAGQFLSSNQQVVNSLASIKFEQILMTRASTPYYEEVIKFPIFDASGQVEAVGGIATDITARKEAELQLQRRNRELDLLNRVIAASVKVTEPEILLDSVCRALAQALDLPIAYAGLLNIAKTSITIVAEYQAIEQPSWLHMVMPNPPVHELLFRRAPLIVDIQNERRLAVLPPETPLQGLVAALVLPLIAEGELSGILSLVTTTTHHFSAEEINLAWSVADQVAGVLARTRLTQAQQLLSVAIEQAGESVIITDRNGVITYVNPAFEESTGYKEAEVIGQSPRILKSGLQDDKFYQNLWEAISSGQVWRGRFTNRKKDDTLFTEEATIVPVLNNDRQIINYVAVKRNITAELRLEEQIRQTQKMDAVGRLAGGVAHDFNNLLVIINGYCNLLLADMDETSPTRQDLIQIKEAGERAAALTRQLLVFSRKQVVQPEVLNLNDIVTDLNKMLRRLIREDIDIITHLSPELGRIKADRGQLTQVILNLAVNARDAMPKGGTLTLETENVVLDNAYISQFLDIEPGPYILFKVSDTGIGMNQETLKQIFEPFFTTKGQGEGTGLGLAIVHSIVKQSGGHIEVTSVPEQGSTFKIYLPRLNETRSLHNPSSPLTELPKGSETILVVEDDVRVRELVCLILKKMGYTVLEAIGGKQAMKLCAECTGIIHLLLTDMVMPEMSGGDLAVLLKREIPALKVLYMTGYPDRFVQQSHQLDIDADFLQKPFTPATLASKVRAVLDTPLK